MTSNDKLVKFPDLAAIEAEAAAWVARLDREDVSAKDHAEFLEWQRRSPYHREAMMRSAQLWANLDVLSELPGLEARGDAHGPAGGAPSGSAGAAATSRRRWMQIAAAVLLVGLMSLAALLTDRSVFGWPQLASYRTAIGGQQTVSLPDGSEMVLNTDSHVRVEFTRGERSIWLLRGEAFFEVAHDTRRPFLVHAGDGVVRAVGTAFAVRLLDEAVEVSVTEGQVELATLAASAPAASAPEAEQLAVQKLSILVAGENARFSQRIDKRSVLAESDMNRKLAWRQGMVVFTGEPLSQVIADISRYTDVRIKIEDPSLENMRVGGYFRVGDVDPMIEVLEKNFGIRAKRVNERLIVLESAS